MIAKTLLLALAAASSATALVTVDFTYYLAEKCSVLGGTAHVAEGSCVNLADFPYKSFDAVTTSGECENFGDKPTLIVYAAPGCESEPLGANVVSRESDCALNAEGFRSVTLKCAPEGTFPW